MHASFVSNNIVHSISSYQCQECITKREYFPDGNIVVSRAFCETIRMTFGVCVCMCVCVCVCVQGISPSITGRILMKLRMDIPVHHAQCV